MKIITCNIRTAGADDGPDNWELRKEICRDVILETRSDVICFQEMTAKQHQYFVKELPDFTWTGASDEPAGRNISDAVFFRTDPYSVSSASSYWLSETPHIPGSSSWDSACVRLATWVRLKETGGEREYRIINTHLDHVSQRAREGQARTIVSDAEAYPQDYPQILTGDLNCNSTNDAMQILFDAGFADTYESVNGTLTPGATFHGFGEERTDLGKIDWILAKGAVRVRNAEIVKANRDGRYPSDHYFVTADLE